MTFDCIVVGGGAAGLSAALVLGRARRRTLLVDAGEPSNRVAHGIGGLLGHDGRAPADFYALGREQLAAYPTVELENDSVTAGSRNGDGFVLELARGDEVHARRVLLATGLEYRTPPIEGLAELWGDSVFHCPFCHGWEVRGQPLAVLAEGDHGPRLTRLLRSWSDDVVLLDRPVGRLLAENGKLTTIVFEDGTTLARSGLLVHTTFHQRSDLAAQLGAATADGGRLEVDDMLATTAPGVYAAGDLTAKAPSVAAAIASGSLAAAMVVHDG